MFARTSNEARSAAYGGAVAGAVAGLALTTMMTLMSLAKGNDVWYGMKGAAAPFLGEVAMQPGFDLVAVSLGLLAHLGVSMAWAVGFGLLFYHASRAMTLLGGIAWAFVVWIGIFYAVLPLVGLGAMTTEAPVGRVIAYHVFFGLGVAAVFLGYERRERLLYPPGVRKALAAR